jgi:hypothetical protein
MSRTFKVYSSAVAKTIKCYDETGSHEDCHRKGRSRVTSAAEDKFIRVTVTGSVLFECVLRLPLEGTLCFLVSRLP